MNGDSRKQGRPNDDQLKRAMVLLEKLRLGDAQGPELADLERLLLADESIREYVVAELQDDALIHFELRLEAAARLFSEGSFSPAGSNLAADAHIVQKQGQQTLEARQRPTLLERTFELLSLSWLSRSSPFAVTALVFLVGFGSALVLARYWQLPGTSESGRSAVAQKSGIGGETIPLVYVGYVGQKSGGRWSTSDARRVESGFGLQAGDTIRLTGGLGQLEFSGGLSLGVEGPAEVAIQSDGIPSLNYGRATARVAWGFNEVQLATPLGDIWLAGGTTAGVASYGSELQVHAFSGDSDIVLPNMDRDSRVVEVREGEARLIDVTHDSRFRIVRIPVSTDMFAARMSMDTDQLAISEDYVNAVLESGALAYWRFEEQQDGLLSNCVSSGHNLLIVGNPQVVEQEENSAIQFGFGVMAGSLVSVEPLDELCGDEYSIEFWLKPAHFHNGAIINLVTKDPASSSMKHGLLLELFGPFLANESRSNAVRFLHRSPSGVGGGAECFSSSNYLVRRWQHVVATKQKSELLLYINGEVTAIGEDDTRLSPGHLLLVGQLYPSERMRPFVGQLDELAMYDRALTGDEVRRHYQAVAR